MRFIEQIYDKGPFPVARSGVRGLSCRRCNAPLPTDSLKPGEIHGTVSIGDLQPFEVSVQAGILTCEACALDQVDARRSATAELSEAFANAFRDGRLDP